MGAEEFRVRVVTELSLDEVRARLLALGQVRPAKWQGSFTYEDDKFILDLQVTGRANGATAKVGFALCQDASIDEFFVSFVLRVVGLVDATSVLTEGTQAAVFRPDWAGLREHIRTSIAEPRRLWQLEFGAETAKLGCDDAMRIYCERPKTPGEG